MDEGAVLLGQQSAERGDMARVEIVVHGVTRLGENPLWDVEEERLYWLDVHEGLVFSSRADGSELQVSRFPARVQSMALRAGGGAILCSGKKIHLFDLETGEHELVFDGGDDPTWGFNDAKVDRQGRFVTGRVNFELARTSSMDLIDTIDLPDRLFRVDADLSVHPIADGIGITNGPCFSPDGKTLYCGDSWSRRMYAFDYDVETGGTSNARIHVAYESSMMPDGSTVDEEGFIWVAAFQADEVRRYAPDGTLDRRIPMPVDNPTSVAFGGSDLDVLFVTSFGRAELPTVALKAEITSEIAGSVFAVHGLGVRGLPEKRFAG
jgi:sugar lactone lactonase YvrE